MSKMKATLEGLHKCQQSSTLLHTCYWKGQMTIGTELVGWYYQLWQAVEWRCCHKTIAETGRWIPTDTEEQYHLDFILDMFMYIQWLLACCWSWDVHDVCQVHSGRWLLACCRSWDGDDVCQVRSGRRLLACCRSRDGDDVLANFILRYRQHTVNISTLECHLHHSDSPDNHNAAKKTTAMTSTTLSGLIR